MKRFYLLSTEHLEDGLWFRDREDLKVAMNYISIEANNHPEVIVLAYILMSNHVHFVYKGQREKAVAFVNSFKRRYSMYYRRRYGVKEFLRGNKLDVREIPCDDEAVEKTIAYVVMNAVAAGICAHPSQYPWGTGSLYFSQVNKGGKCLKDLSARARKRLLHSESIQLPEDWPVSEEGYILPSAYVDVKSVEAIFRTPKRMNYFLSNSSKAKKRLLADENLPSFKDQTILSALPDLCRSLFQKDSFGQLTTDEKKEFARQIRFRFSADATQIARVCGISYAEAAQLLDSI